MQKDDKTNIHAGHRNRLLQLVYKNGLENLSEVQALEYVLMLCIPRVDTNPVAHALLQEFGSFTAVLDADPRLVQKVRGMGERSALTLANFKHIFNIYLKCKNEKHCNLSNIKDMASYVKRELALSPTEKLYIFVLNNHFTLLGRQCFDCNSDNVVEVEARHIAGVLTKFDASKIFVAHNHPSGNPYPSSTDIENNERIKAICNALGVTFIDHLILGNSQIFSFNYSRILEV